MSKKDLRRDDRVQAAYRELCVRWHASECPPSYESFCEAMSRYVARRGKRQLFFTDVVVAMLEDRWPE